MNFACPKFINLSVSDRRNRVAQLKLCRNCLAKWSPNHRCSFTTCKKCGQYHHTLLHLESSRSERSSLSLQSSTQDNDSRQSYVSFRASTFNSRNLRGNHSHDSSSQASSARVTSATTLFTDTSRCYLLVTAIVLVSNGNNTPVKCRALLDGGSDCNLMTFSCKDKLDLPTFSTNVNVAGFCLASYNVSKSVNITLRSIHSNFQTDIKCLLVNQITSISHQLILISWHLPAELAYVEPEFYLSKPVEILTGADLFFNLLLPGA